MDTGLANFEAVVTSAVAAKRSLLRPAERVECVVAPAITGSALTRGLAAHVVRTPV